MPIPSGTTKILLAATNRFFKLSRRPSLLEQVIRVLVRIKALFDLVQIQRYAGLLAPNDLGPMLVHQMIFERSQDE